MSVNLRSALLMILAMGLFSLEDAVIKLLTDQISPGQVLLIVGIGGLLAFAVWMAVTGRRIWVPEFLAHDVLARSACEMFGGMAFVTALSLIPLTTASAVIQATPLVVASGAALFLGNTVGWRRWLAIGIGFFGVMLIIRPGGESFQAATLLAVLGMLGLAARDLITRGMKSDVDGPHLSMHAYGAVALAGALLMPFEGHGWSNPDLFGWGLLLLCVLISMGAYLAVVSATRVGDAAVTSSYRYSRMLFALIIGFIFFGETPDFMTYLGISIVIVAGLYTLIREARLSRSGQAS